MPGMRKVVVARMDNVDDRYVTRPVQIPEWARFMGLFVPGIADAGNVGVDISPFPHFYNFPAPGYYTKVPELVNPYTLRESPNLSYAEGGVIPPGGRGYVGEAGMEAAYALPGGGVRITPLGDSAGYLPAVIQVVVGGEVVRYTEERLALRRRTAARRVQPAGVRCWPTRTRSP